MTPEFEIQRSVLVQIIDKAINEGRGQLRTFVHSPYLERFKVDSLRDVARTCQGVDFFTYKCKYGCPVEQAGLKGAYGLWFTMPFDRLMKDFLECPHTLEQGWAVKVIDE